MELESLVTKLVTDRHIQVSAYMANEKPHVEHSYDVWHLAKGRIAFTVHGFPYYLHRNLAINYHSSYGYHILASHPFCVQKQDLFARLLYQRLALDSHSDNQALGSQLPSCP